MDSVDQIAAEAWKQITDYADNCEDGVQDLQGDTNCIRFIKAAIEKAVALERERLEDKWKASMQDVTTALQSYESRAAHTSEQLYQRCDRKDREAMKLMGFDVWVKPCAAQASEL